MASSSDERYVWPWTGIVANIFGKPKHEPVECDSMYWLRKFEQYKPEEAYVLHCAEDPTGYVVLEFGTEWTGFSQMMKLDTDFLVDHHGKKDYYESRKMGYSSGLFGWCAQAEDYNSEGLVGNFLRQKAELKTTSMVAQESLNEKTETLDHLYGEIGSVNKKISEMESKYIEDYMSLDKMMKEIEKKRDLLHQTRAEATEKQMKARSDVLSLLEKHQMEKKAVSDALLKLEKEMGNEQKLNLEIAELEEQLKVLKCVNLEEADHENKRKIEIEEIEEKLEDMIFDMSVKDDENQALKKKVQEAKIELEDARQQIIKAYVAVVTALKELPEYHHSDDAENTHNSSEKQVIPEIWDSQNGRRATVTEALKYASNLWFSKTENNKQFPSLQHDEFVKWWNQFDTSKAQPDKVKIWFKAHLEFLKAPDPETSLFLNQKSQLAAFLARSNSKEHLMKKLKEVLQLLQIQLFWYLFE
ncbi:factor of DNA methylation 5 [Glycine max]|uniref:factor of DNA methylation 5 n=1 Tax=Glycine max TaxID=3847 RepID=UPI001B357112|nr:factor of DNA methylation 5 [Glycine max]